jgi:DNA-binding response OmpR family regulator
MKEPNINILLAEDDENLGKLLWTYLKNKGFDVVLAKNGKLAYDLFNDPKNSFDFLILDVMMPEMDGFTLAKEIRELDKQIPFLFLTAKAMAEDKLKGFEIGADDYLTKPFSMEELLARMNATLNRTKSKKESCRSKSIDRKNSIRTRIKNASPCRRGKKADYERKFIASAIGEESK